MVGGLQSTAGDLNMTKAGICSSALVLLVVQSMPLDAAQREKPSTRPADRAVTAAAPAVRPDYVIAPDDVLAIVFWRDKDLSGDVVVRPDGKITLPLLRDIEAAGSTPEQLRTRLMQAAARYLEDPDATVVVKEIRSRNVFITGNVAKPGTYPLSTGMKVLQCIALAGGVLDTPTRRTSCSFATKAGARITQVQLQRRHQTETRRTESRSEAGRYDCRAVNM